MENPGAQPQGFSLIEVIVATLIATLVITGLAYTFGLGRGFIDRYEIARAALAEAQGRMDELAVRASFDDDSTVDFFYQGRKVGSTVRFVNLFNDDGPPATVRSLKRVVIQVTWATGSLTDTVRVDRLFPAF